MPESNRPAHHESKTSTTDDANHRTAWLAVARFAVILAGRAVSLTLSKGREASDWRRLPVYP